MREALTAEAVREPRSVVTMTSRTLFDDACVSALEGERWNEHGATLYVGCRDGVQTGGRLSAAQQVLTTG